METDYKNYRISRRYYVILLLVFIFNTALSQENALRTPYPIIFVHGIVGDKSSFTDGPDGIYDIVDFFTEPLGNTPLQKGGILNISLDWAINPETRNSKKEDNVHLYNVAAPFKDIYIVNFAVHAKENISFSTGENTDVANVDIGQNIQVYHSERFRIGDIIRIEDEYMEVTGINASTLTVNRSLFGSKTTSHLNAKIFNLSRASNQAAIAKQGLGILKAIEEVKLATNAKKVILVGHSMGGLAIREYIRTYFSERQDVAKVVTIGTPHYGSNLTGLTNEFITVMGIDYKSEAIRDLKTGGDDILSYLLWGYLGTYLFGGAEEDISEKFYSKDVDCDGTEDGYIFGVNDFNHISFPENLSRTWIASNAKNIYGTYTGNDGVVLTKSQYIRSDDTIMTHTTHISIGNTLGESKDVYALIRGLDEPYEKELAYEINKKSSNKGFITFNAFNSALDVDLYKIVIEKDGILTFSFLGTEKTGISRIILMDEDTNPLKTINSIFETIEYNVTPGTYYLQIRGLATSGVDATYKNPYTIKTNFVEPAQSALVTNPKNLFEYYDVVVNEFRDKNVTLSNTGTTTISVSEMALAGIDANQFVIVNPALFDLAPAQNKTITIRFNPTISGEKNATLTIANNSTETPVKSLSLKGIGVDSPTKRLVLNPDFSYNYNNVTITKTKNKTITFQNRGSNTLTVTGLSLSGLNSGEYSVVDQPVIPFDLETGEVKQAIIKFSPSTVGVKTSDFVVTNNSDNGSPEYPVVLFGNGTNSVYTGIYNTITAYEYWFDDNYNSKKDTSFAPQQMLSLNTSISIEGLNFGLHRFHLRVKDTKGRWSVIASEFFYKLPSLPEGDRVITACEYWFDDDFAHRISADVTPGQTITTIVSLDVSTLKTGLHNYHSRYKDNAGQWSSVVSESFHKLPVAVAGSRSITVCEYWYDDDFAHRKSAGVTPGQTFTTIAGLDVSSLQTGLHSYHTRYKDDVGQWSSVATEVFYKLRETGSLPNLITEYRYWYDMNSSTMLTVKLSAPVNPYQLIKDINTCGLTGGNHTIHFQFKDSWQAWSSIVSETFYIDPVSIPEITANGPTTFCQGGSVTLASSQANFYLWNNGATTQYITVSNAGDYFVSSNNGCINSFPSNTITITVNTLPLVPEIPLGPDFIDLKKTVSTEYSIPAVTKADSYVWSIMPESAGEISGSGLIGTVTWNPSYVGYASIKVMSANSCGQSALSTEKSTYVDNFTGTNDAELSSLVIYPNPNDGSFYISYPKPLTKVIIRDAIGKNIDEVNFPKSDHSYKYDLNEGVYLVYIYSSELSFVRKIIVKKAR